MMGIVKDLKKNFSEKDVSGGLIFFYGFFFYNICINY